MKPRHPTRSARWRLLGPAPLLPDCLTFRHRHFQVLSGVEAGEWHVSVSSLRQGTISDADLELVREAFGMQDAIEERGVFRRGRVRHLWLPAAMVMAS